MSQHDRLDGLVTSPNPRVAPSPNPLVRFGLVAVQFVKTVERLYGPQPHEIAVALALAVRGPSFGHVCVDLSSVVDDDTGLDDPSPGGSITADGPVAFAWPELDGWLEVLTASPSVTTVAPVGAEGSGLGGVAVGGPSRSQSSPATSIDPMSDALLVLSGTRLYLRRYFDFEVRVASVLANQATQSAPAEAVQSTPSGIGRIESIEPTEPAQAGAVAATPWAEPKDPRVVEVLDRFFPHRNVPGNGPDDDRQLAAVYTALSERLLILAGGPGTGKTRTVAVMLLALLASRGQTDAPLRIALAAPTGKAAARMTEAVIAEVGDAASDIEVTGQTIHRLLGFRPADHVRADGFLHDRSRPLPHDVIIVDEVSMVSLPLMVSLLEAADRGCRLVLVGDPYQLASVEAGSVLRDIVWPRIDEPEPMSPEPMSPESMSWDSGSGSVGAEQTGAKQTGPQQTGVRRTGVLDRNIVVLNKTRRFAPDSQIAYLADAIRQGDVRRARALVRSAAPGSDDTAASPAELTWIDIADAGRDSMPASVGPDAVLRAAPKLADELNVQVAAQIAAAVLGDGGEALRISASTRMICATRVGSLGSTAWNAHFDRVARSHFDVWSEQTRWFDGRPLMVTQNDYLNELFNGDSGVVVSDGGVSRACFPAASGLRFVDFARLEMVEPNWAMTIHKSQGSEFDHVVVVLPPPPMNLLTRELLYTAVTRAKKRVTLVASLDSIDQCVLQQIRRPSGLTDRLWRK